MCVNALTEINKTYPNLSFFLFFPSQVLLEKKKLDDLRGFLQLKMVTLKLRPGDYESHPTYVSSPSQKKKKKSHIILLSVPRQTLITTHT